MMRSVPSQVWLIAAAAVLSACQPPAPAGRPPAVGFENYSDYLARREAELMAARRAPQVVQPPQNYAGPQDGVTVAGSGAPTAAELAAAGVGGAAAIAGQQAGAQGAVAPSAVAPSAAAPAPAPGAGHGGISDEQDFSAVAQRETIESDRQRLEQNRAQYQQVQPAPLPPRPATADTAVELVEYAVNAPNRLHESIYPRSGFSLSSHEKACARYASPEEAQIVFLNSGGPKRDPKNLDPDGDGFACHWDPTPFQTVRR